MKKFAILSVVLMAALAFVAAPAFAGPNCSANDSKTTSAKLASANTCTAGDKAACAAKLGISVEECEALCKELGDKCDFQHISIEGMTCGGCESSIKTALLEAPGVVKVVRVSYKDGTAIVAVDREKFNGQTTAKMITDKGYKAEIIPAVAVSTDAPAKMTGATSGCSKTCTSKEKAACAAKEKTDSKDTKAGGTQ